MRSRVDPITVRLDAVHLGALEEIRHYCATEVMEDNRCSLSEAVRFAIVATQKLVRKMEETENGVETQ